MSPISPTSPVSGTPTTGEDDVRRRVRHQARDALAVMACSIVCSLGCTLTLVAVLRLGR